MSRLNAKSFFDEGLTNDAHLRALEELYDSEINWSIECFWDGGFTAKLGDDMNGFDTQGCFDTLREAIKFLANEAINKYPKSTFAKDWGEFSLCDKCNQPIENHDGGK